MCLVQVKSKIINREQYLDLLRILAIFFVIVLHVSGENFRNIDINSTYWDILNFYDSISRWVFLYL